MATKPALTISVADLTTGQLVTHGQTLQAEHVFQVTVSGNGVDCAGQFVVTALGAPGAPPSVLVQTVRFIIGPGVNKESVTGEQLTAHSLGTGKANNWKISASGNGTKSGEFAFASFEFVAQ